MIHGNPEHDTTAIPGSIAAIIINAGGDGANT
jgi:hypothetical protein